MKRSLSLACAAWITLAGVALAQETVPYKDEEWTVLPEERWGELSVKDFGKRFCVTGRWQQIHGSGILLYRARINTKPFLNIGAGPLKDNLAAGLSGMGQRLERKVSVVRVFGKAARGPQGTYLSVQQVLKLPDAAESYREQLAKLGDDADQISRLARACAAEAKRYEDEALQDVARQIARRELEVRAQGLAPDAHAKRFELAQRFRTEAHDASSAIALYSKVHEAEQAPAALRKKAGEALIELNAVRIRQGRETWVWVTYQEFKSSEGYLLRQPKDGQSFYIRKEVAELLEVIAEETRRQAEKIDPPRQNPFKAGQDARTGKILRGQTYAEVRAAAKSFPVRVHHRIERWAPSKGRALWTQWEMPGGGRVYFLSIETEDEGRLFFPPGEVVARRPQGTPWPSN